MKWSKRPGFKTFALDVSFETSGYSDPGNNYGPPENCYPPEGEVDDCSLVELTIDGIVVPLALAAQLFEFLTDPIIEHVMAEPPEYEPFDDDVI